MMIFDILFYQSYTQKSTHILSEARLRKLFRLTYTL